MMSTQDRVQAIRARVTRQVPGHGGQCAAGDEVSRCTLHPLRSFMSALLNELSLYPEDAEEVARIQAGFSREASEIRLRGVALIWSAARGTGRCTLAEEDAMRRYCEELYRLIRKDTP